MSSMPGRKPLLFWLGALALVSLLSYQAASFLTYRIGFPLDDAWIHQTYARNLAQRGEWAYLPGEPSAGSTSPLWTVLLAFGQFFRLPAIGWSAVLGVVILAALAFLAYAMVAELLPGRPLWSYLAAVVMLFEWHLVWAAGSGMETALHAALSLWIIYLLAREPARWLMVGILVGLAAWVRPDGITLIGPALWTLAFRGAPLRLRLVSSVRLLGGFLLAFAPYLIFNRWLAGAWWPNTYFAKQAEYAAELSQPLLDRLVEQAAQPLVGVGALLLPGLLFFVYQQVCERRVDLLAGVLWALGYLGVYALRLPVTYQHGRYIIPAMAAYFAFGWLGLAGWCQLDTPVFSRRVLSRAWLVSALAVLMGFWFLGMRAFARDVAFIESEMVETARWIQKNTQPADLIAAHDIGALGYFAGRRLVDLAGLVSPEVIPFIRDEPRLAAFLDAARVDYLVTFPGWYPLLTAGKSPVYLTGGEFAPADGYENMAIYPWLTNP